MSAPRSISQIPKKSTGFVRACGPGDRAALETMHRSQGFDYELPDFDRPDWAVRMVVETESGNPQMALLLRRTAEAYFLIGANAGSESERIGKTLVMQKEGFEILRGIGYRDVYAWISPEVEASFGTVLGRCGWKRPMWKNFRRQL